MLKYKILRNIGLIISVILVIQILFIFPDKHEYISKIDTENSVIYLFDNNNYVSRVNIRTKEKDKELKIREIIALLTKNTSENYRLRDGFTAPIPENTKLLSLDFDENTVILNFSKEFNNIEPNMEEKMYEAIIFSLTAIDEVDSIIIKVNNQVITKLYHSDKIIPEKLDRTFRINKEYETFALSDIQEVVVIYPACIDDFIYYVPVTKYTDKKNEKIEIIIEELKSSSTYNTNLISYINEETQLINYELVDKSLILNFSDTIFTDLTSKNIREEITYSINSSIEENYQDIDNILYYVNNYIINNYFLPLG